MVRPSSGGDITSAFAILGIPETDLMDGYIADSKAYRAAAGSRTVPPFKSGKKVLSFKLYEGLKNPL